MKHSPSEYSITDFTATKTLIIDLNKVSSYDVDIYASFESVRPSSDSYMWRSLSTGRMVIEDYDPRFQEGDLFISVLSRHPKGSLFSIVATSGLREITLKNATVVDGSLAKGGFNYYVIHVESIFTETIVDLKSSLGSNGLYISKKTSRPGPDAFTWSSTGSEASKKIIISSTDPEFGSGPLHISVYGQTTSHYEILTTLIPV